MDLDQPQSQRQQQVVEIPWSSNNENDGDNDEEAPSPEQLPTSPQTVDLLNVVVVTESVEHAVAPPSLVRTKPSIGTMRVGGIRCCVWHICLSFSVSTIILVMVIAAIVIVQGQWAKPGARQNPTMNPGLNASVTTGPSLAPTWANGQT